MALTFTEKWESGSGNLSIGDTGDTKIYIVSGDPVTDNADDQVTVVTFAMKQIATLNQLVSALGNILNGVGFVRTAPGVWEFTFTYKFPSYEKQTGEASFCFTTGGGTQKITQSLATVNSYAAPASGGQANFAPNYRGAIGANGVGDVEGVEIEFGSFDFKTTFYIPKSMVISTGYVAILKSLTKKVNNSIVNLNVDGVQLTFQPGELRLVGAEGSERRGVGDFEVTLNWSSSDNASNLTVGDITGIVKRGWDYLWVLYHQQNDTGSSTLVPTAKAVYVEQVYHYADLNPAVPALSGFITGGSPFGFSNK